MPPAPETQFAPAPRATRYDVRAAAEYLGLSLSFLNKARLYGNGPTYLKLGSKVVYERADLDDWLASRRRRSTSQTVAA